MFQLTRVSRSPPQYGEDGGAWEALLPLFPWVMLKDKDHDKISHGPCIL